VVESVHAGAGGWLQVTPAHGSPVHAPAAQLLAQVVVVWA
jgi:hypothetical protein